MMYKTVFFLFFIYHVSMGSAWLISMRFQIVDQLVQDDPSSKVYPFEDRFDLSDRVDADRVTYKAVDFIKKRADKQGRSSIFFYLNNNPQSRSYNLGLQDGADYLKEIYTAGKDQDKTIVSVNFSKNDEIQFRFLRAVADKLVGNLPLLNTEGTIAKPFTVRYGYHLPGGNEPEGIFEELIPSQKEAE